MVIKKNHLFVIQFCALVGIFCPFFLWVSLNLTLSDLKRVKHGLLASHYNKTLVLLKRSQITLIITQSLLLTLYIVYHISSTLLIPQPLWY